MESKSWTLTDLDGGVYVDALTIGPADVGGGDEFSVVKRRLHGGLRDGVDVVEVDNGACRFTVLPSRGMGIQQAAAGDVRLGWGSPVRGPVNPAFVRLDEPGGLGWLDGFTEFLCRCGLESNGPPVFNEDGRLQHPLHGKLANTPAWRVEVRVDGDEIAVTGVVDEARLYHNKLRLTSTVSTRRGQPGFRISDEVVNVSGEPGELELLYHINFGAPLLEPGAKVVAPVKTYVPRDARAAEGAADWQTYGEPQAGFTEQVNFFDLAADDRGDTRVLLRNAHGNHGAGILFNKQQLPTFTQWKSSQLPGDGYVTGLEPAINFPNHRDFEKQHGRVAVMPPGAKLRFEVAIEIYTDADAVADAEAAVAKLQAGVQPKIYDRPITGWSPEAG